MIEIAKALNEANQDKFDKNQWDVGWRMIRVLLGCYNYFVMFGEIDNVFNIEILMAWK